MKIADCSSKLRGTIKSQFKACCKKSKSSGSVVGAGFCINTNGRTQVLSQQNKKAISIPERLGSCDVFWLFFILVLAMPIMTMSEKNYIFN